MDVVWLQPLATVVAALLALTGAALLVRQSRAAATQRALADDLLLVQRDAADAKEQWWVRTQWALERSFSEVDVERELAYDLIDLQGASALADDEDRALLEAVVRRTLLGPELDPDLPGDTGPDSGGALDSDDGGER